MRWAIDHCIVSAVTNHLLDSAGVSSSQDITNNLSPNRIKKGALAIKNFLSAVQTRMNPFDQTLNTDCLFNISSGKSAPPEVVNYLLSAERVGTEKRDDFLSKCADDIDNFEKITIKRVPVKNFSSTVNKKIKAVKTSLKVLKVQSYLFGQLLRIALENNVDMSKVLAYPLFEVSLSLCHIDGTIFKTDKSVLTKQLEKTIKEHVTPEKIDITVYDEFAIFHEMKTVPQTFGNISLAFLKKICRTEATEIHLVFDTYKTPSIKIIEHELRDSFNIEYEISSLNQELPCNFYRELRNNVFKENLVRFLINHWSTDDVRDILGTKTVYVNFEICYKFTVQDETVVRTVENSLTCQAHEKADTKIVFHACNLQKEEANVVIRCTDTDVVVIMLANICNLSSHNLNIWMEYGTGNHRRYIDISKIHETLGEDACRGLAGFHAFTGCDYISSFYHKGKVKPLKLLLSKKEFQQAFTYMIDDEEDSFSVIEQFTCW